MSTLDEILERPWLSDPDDLDRDDQERELETIRGLVAAELARLAPVEILDESEVLFSRRLV
jgi:hypothetical protein